MKKKILTITMALMISVSLMACAGDSKNTESKEKEPAKKEYISDSEIADMFTNPGDFKGKYVKITGKIFTTPEKDGDIVALQIWNDPQNAENNFIVHYKTAETFNTDEYVSVDGKIAGTFKGENMMGGTVTAPLIKADTIEVISYIDAIAPTEKEYILKDLSVTQHDVTVKLDKVEYSENETRIYVTATNASADKFNLYTYSIKLIQDGQQIEQDSGSYSAYEGNYPQLSSEILPGASTSGILVFPKMDYTVGFQLYAEGSSDNWELQFNPFTMQITVN